jgi:hypothetical protein
MRCSAWSHICGRGRHQRGRAILKGLLKGRTRPVPVPRTGASAGAPPAVSQLGELHRGVDALVGGGERDLHVGAFTGP